jgi:hypothetical protein
MAKRFIALCIVFSFICTFLTSCGPLYGVKEALALDEDLHNIIKAGENSYGENYYIIYQDTKYYCDEMYLFSLHGGSGSYVEGDVWLSWNGPRFFYKNFYYSDTAENPVFIYEIRCDDIFFREDYDYKSDTFVIEGTDKKFVFSDAITEQEVEYDLFKTYYEQKDFVIYSEKYPRIRTELTLFFESGEWCVIGTGYFGFAITDEFAEILTEEGIIVK